jgi:phospholipase C
LTVHDHAHDHPPWHYTIGAGDQHVSEQWHAETNEWSDPYGMTLVRPDGALRRFAGVRSEAATKLKATLVQLPHSHAIALTLGNVGSEPQAFDIEVEAAYVTAGARRRSVTVLAGGVRHGRWQLDRSDRWYDLTVTAVGGEPYLRRFAGKVETGGAGRTAPAIGVMRI